MNILVISSVIVISILVKKSLNYNYNFNLNDKYIIDCMRSE